MRYTYEGNGGLIYKNKQITMPIKTNTILHFYYLLRKSKYTYV